MGVIINPRGTAGSGKTTLARRLVSEYRQAEPLRRGERDRPIACRLRHPLGRRPLVVIGHYERTRGGCDTITVADGGLDEAFRLARCFAASGHDVLLEGLLLSSERPRSIALAATHAFHIIRLDTPLERCIRNLIARQRAGKRSRETAARTATVHHGQIEEACRQLQDRASVETLDFDRALRRARHLLGLAECG